MTISDERGTVMTDLMRTLYEFAEEQDLGKTFLDKEHSKYKKSAYSRFEKIVEEYPQLLRPLDDFISDLNACYSFEQEAAFQVGFLLYGELTRLQRSYEGLFE